MEKWKKWKKLEKFGQRKERNFLNPVKSFELFLFMHNTKTAENKIISKLPNLFIYI